MKKVILIISLAITLLSATSNYQKGRDAYRDKNYFQALKYFLISARERNINAYMELALMYEKGIGTRENRMTALYWYSKARRAGSSYAKKKLTPEFIKELKSTRGKSNNIDSFLDEKREDY